jgi:hypothetical protein
MERRWHRPQTAGLPAAKSVSADRTAWAICSKNRFHAMEFFADRRRNRSMNNRDASIRPLGTITMACAPSSRLGLISEGQGRTL